MKDGVVQVDTRKMLEDLRVKAEMEDREQAERENEQKENGKKGKKKREGRERKI